MNKLTLNNLVKLDTNDIIMKKKLLLLSVIIGLCFLNNPSYSQSFNWDWANTATGTYRDEASSVATDGLGNTYVTGYFLSSTITFESITLTNAGPEGSWDLFLVKYDKYGNVLWAKSAGGLGFDVSNSITIDSLGYVYITGYFMSATIGFDSIYLINNGWDDIFLTKYDPDGNAIWAISAGGIRDDIANAVTVDNLNNVYFTGKYGSPIIYFGSDSLINTNYPFPSDDIFFAKYDSNGNLNWIKNIGGSNNDAAMSIATDMNRNIYLAGTFKSASLYFESDSLTNFNNKSDYFLIKYNEMGNIDWSLSGGGSDNDTATSVITDKLGNIYLGGSFKSQIFYFDGGSFLNTNEEPYSTDIFILKINNAGELVWAKQIGGLYDEFLTSLGNGNSEDITVTGVFDSQEFVFQSDTLPNMGYNDIFILNLNENGNTNWVTSIGDQYSEYAHSVFVDQNNNVYVSGFFTSPSLSFDSTILLNNAISSLFVAKLSNGPIGINNFEEISSIKVFPNPSSDVITIKTPHRTELEISNIGGQVIKRFTTSQKSTSIDISNFKNGIYLIKAEFSNRTTFLKFIKQ